MLIENFLRLVYIGLNFIQKIGHFGYQFAFVPIKENDIHQMLNIGRFFNPISALNARLIERYFGDFTYFEFLLTIGLGAYCIVVLIKIILNLINPIKL